MFNCWEKSCKKTHVFAIKPVVKKQQKNFNNCLKSNLASNAIQEVEATYFS